MKKNNIQRRITSLFLATAFSFTALAAQGCGEQAVSTEETVTLLEPAGVAKSIINPEYRNLYETEVVAGYVCPAVNELSYGYAVNFDSFAKMPGELINKGDAIVYGDTTNIDKQIESMQETIKNQEKTHEETSKELQEKLEKDKKDYEEKLKQYEWLCSIEDVVKAPFKQADGSYDFDATVSDADRGQYNYWVRTFNSYDSSYRYALMAYEKDKIDVEKEQKLYDLDHQYNVNQLKSMKKERAEKVLYTNVTGTVVSVNVVTGTQRSLPVTRSRGSWVAKNYSMAAVADLSVKEIRTKFVNRSTMNTATEYYAVIHGKRYEVEYEALTSEEYKRLQERDKTVYSTFTLKDPDDSVGYGDFGEIIIIKDKRENVMCVPTDCLSKDDSGTYLYVYDNGKYVATYVKTGMKDGMYTEILSGIDASTQIKADYKIKSGSHTAEVGLGRVTSEFTGMGTYFYPSTKDVTNPIKYGTTYITEICVKRNQRVEKGDVMVRVRVVPDSIEIERRERQILRMNEQLADLVKNNDEDGKNDKSIKNMQEQIADAEKALKEIKDNSKITTIKAPSSGVITGFFTYNEGDLISYNTLVAQIADESSCYIIVSDEEGKLSYGNSVTVAYEDRNGNTLSVAGKVVTANNMCLSATLSSQYALVTLDPDDMGELLKMTNAAGSVGFWDIPVFTVMANLRTMDNVVVIPRTAVTDYGGSTYVTVRQEDGTLKSVAFISGGSDTTAYWVAEGLTEGMTICWE